MSFLSILETIFIGPLKLVFEIVFAVAYRFIGHPGWAIVVLSLVMNILVLPLYKRADAMQEEAKNIENKLSKGVTHIKKTFSGDERMMILQEYYKQNHYKPTMALRGSISLLLEIPFFMAAYQCLSHLEILKGVSLGPIRDLGAPDGLLMLGGLTINLLPVIMTLINVVSGAIYLKGFPLKSKIQLYGIALVFLVFLYSSPSGLVFYWTLNNIFSLVKNILYKVKNPQKIIRILVSAVGIMIMIFAAFIYESEYLKRKAFLLGLGILMQAPWIALLLQKKKTFEEKVFVPNRKVFVLGAVFMTVIVGGFIPSSYIAASPQEFMDIELFRQPLWYICSSISLAAGTFLVWMSVFYWLATPKGKVVFEKLVWIMCGMMAANYMFFGTELGNISSSLQYDDGLVFSQSEIFMNLLVLVIIAGFLYFLTRKAAQGVVMVLLISVIALSGMSIWNMRMIKGAVAQVSVISENTSDIPEFQLSKNGKNVVVIMLDRALNLYVPYIFNEKPELKEQYDGFTYYANTISFGGTTNFGAPALLGGYEYTPVEMNKRSDEPLVTKHNEAVKMMPVMFLESGYDVSVFDPVYANYQWIPDISVFSDYPEINAQVTTGKFINKMQKAQTIQNNYRNFFCFSMMKTMPLFVQNTLYDGGRYNQMIGSGEELYSNQKANSISAATGISKAFMEPYSVLCELSAMTQIVEEDKNTFMFMGNNTTHEPMLLAEPEYTPSFVVDNAEYDRSHKDRFTVNGITLNVTGVSQMSHYQTNMAVHIQLGKWFDYLRENGVYDNTRIILVSDHGRGLAHIEGFEQEAVYPLLMVKDFDCEGFMTSDEFMTNADVPVMAANGLIADPHNPFTGKPINSNEKTAHDQFVIISDEWDVNVNNGNVFLPSPWISVRDDMRDSSNWTMYDKEIVLSEHSF